MDRIVIFLDGFYTWATRKHGNDFEYIVKHVKPLDTPINGSYARNTIILTGLKPTRAQAAGIAKRWVKWYKFEQDCLRNSRTLPRLLREHCPNN